MAEEKLAAPQHTLRLRRSLTSTHQCQRCGQQETLHAVGRWTDADYIELFHERMELERRLRDALASANTWRALHASATERANG
jgi:hypothetical protein